MDSLSPKKSSFNNLLIDHNIIDFKYDSHNHLNNLYKLDENEKKLLDFISDKKKFKIKSYYEHQKEDFDFLSTKFEAMEKINLDDECLVKGEIETKNTNINKKKSQKSKDKTNFISSENKMNINNVSIQKSEKNINNKNIVINANGKIEKTNIESIDLVDDINLDIEKELKEVKSNKFFSNKKTLILIINEMKKQNK